MCIDCVWQEHQKIIDALKAAGKHRWAFDVLDGIQKWVDANHHITERQAGTVRNIARKR